VSNEDQNQVSKLVVDAYPANAFRVVGVGHDVVVESFYLFPDFATVQANETQAFNLDPDNTSEPNTRMVMNREVALRLANALLGALGFQVVQQPAAEQQEPAAVS